MAGKAHGVPGTSSMGSYHQPDHIRSGVLTEQRAPSSSPKLWGAASLASSAPAPWGPVQHRAGAWASERGSGGVGVGGAGRPEGKRGPSLGSLLGWVKSSFFPLPFPWEDLVPHEGDASFTQRETC